MRQHRALLFAAAVIALISLTACFGGGSGETSGAASLRQAIAELRASLAKLLRPADGGGAAAPFTLQLLHAADMDGTAGALQNVENFSALLAAFRAQYPENTLVLSSGDNYIPGPRYYAAGYPELAPALGVAGPGRGDIALLNAMGFQASAVGNHELDRGTAAFASIIAAETGETGRYPGAMFPYLSSNLGFAADSALSGLTVADGQDAAQIGGKLAGSTLLTIGGQRIGIIGATTPALPRITASGDITVRPADYSPANLAAVIQESVDALTAQGINKIILLAHMQSIAIEQELAARLADVDIIVAGGSNTLLADATDRLRPGDAAQGAYPLRYQSPSGQPALLVNSDGDYRYLGRLVVAFDADGRIIPDSVNPNVSGVYATDAPGAGPPIPPPIPEVSRIAQSLRSALRERDGNILGRTAVYLSGRRQAVRTQETNLGNLATDAYLWLARQLDPQTRAAMTNAGGIRGDIGQIAQPPGTTSPDDAQYLPPPANPIAGKQSGDISQLDLEVSLRFNDGLVIIPLTPPELVAVIEHALGADGIGEIPTGQFLQVAGMRFSYAPDAPPGRRLRSLALVDDGGKVTDRVVENGAIAGDPQRQIKLVTLNFLANRGGGYPFPLPHPARVDLAGEAAGRLTAPNPAFPDTNGNGVIDAPMSPDPGRASFAAPGREQDALAEYLAQFFAETPYAIADTDPLHDRRIQNLGLPGMTDTVFLPGNAD